MAIKEYTYGNYGIYLRQLRSISMAIKKFSLPYRTRNLTELMDQFTMWKHNGKGNYGQRPHYIFHPLG